MLGASCIIAFWAMILPLIFSVVQGLVKPVSFLWLVPINAVLYGICVWSAYELGITQQLSTYTAFNFTLLLIVVVSSTALLLVSDDNFSFWDNIPLALGIVMIVGSLGVGCFTGIKSHFEIRPSAQTIIAKKMGDDKIPTLNKSDTPEPLAPKTIFQEIDNNWSKVPHPNAFDIARNNNGDKEIQAQYYHGKPVYIVPLQFHGHNYYHYYRKLPGYWMISATDPNDSPKFIHKPINYSDSSYFNHNTDRRLYMSHPEAVEMSNNAQLEIDNHKNPYYVETLRKANSTYNRPNFDKLEVAVVNAKTGKAHLYKRLDQAPKFIDESITSDVANTIANVYGRDRGGYWNIHKFLWFGGHHNNVMKPTTVGPEDDMTTVFHKGHITYETDMTTPGSGHSALGVLTVDGRTGHIKLYKSKGMNDGESAEDQANRNYDQHDDWTARMPVPYDVENHPTWVTVITDSQGRIKRFYYQEAHDFNVTADGNTPAEALDNYKSELTSNAGSNHSSSAAKSSKVKGTVDRVVASPTRVEFTLQGSKKWYVSEGSDTSAVLMRSGDKVAFKGGYNGVGHSAKDLTDSALD